MDRRGTMRDNSVGERGGVAEWFKAPVLKTGDLERVRGFESLPLRCFPVDHPPR